MLEVVHPVCKYRMPGELFIVCNGLGDGNDCGAEKIIRFGMLIYVIVAKKIKRGKKCEFKILL